MKKIILAIVFFVFLIVPSSLATNAGILPYYYNSDGELYFLIGQEPNGEWADFGGRMDPGEDTKTTALREFSEETRLVFGKYAKNVKLTKKVPVKKYLQASIQYIKPRITGYVNHPKNYYRMYLAQVDYIPAHVFEKAAKIPHYEKTHYAWVPAEDFVNTIVAAKDRRKAYYGNKKIRRQIVDVLQTKKMSQLIDDLAENVI